MTEALPVGLREEQLPHCGHCLVPMVPAVDDGRPLWRCPSCRIVAIAYLPAREHD